MSLLNIIKSAGAGAVDAGNPVAMLFAEVTQMNPLELNVDQRFTLTEDFLIIPESLTRYEIDLKHKHDALGGSTQDALPQKIVIREGLKNGDNVLLLRVQGGNSFIILDKVVKG
ncbi:DUF2577 domain-containing protein [Paenibacillus sp. N1-5-1-14]|uniref:DUF2577 domain-containing protein n=1 Tax=Paenibacillus radicibacter TaxID=2972488 RepID=UPI002159649F|nr:DUF2577 domain-containing protein [Paenibacillus radicibacter]MCR8645570.1 DUF2577 domain-containing protein [Paenibacillus radicibacter]